MKQTAFAFVCILIASATYSQISKGQKMIGGELTFQSTKNENIMFAGDYKTTSVTISPQIGFGLAGKWIVGGGVGYGYQSAKSGTGSNYTKEIANVFSVGLFARKFHPFNDKVGIFGQLDAGTGFGKYKEKIVNGSTSVTTDERKAFNLSGRIKPGFYFKATPRLILEAGFGGLMYTHSTNKPESGGSKVTTSDFSFSILNTLSFGFQVVL